MMTIDTDSLLNPVFLMIYTFIVVWTLLVLREIKKGTKRVHRSLDHVVDSTGSLVRSGRSLENRYGLYGHMERIEAKLKESRLFIEDQFRQRRENTEQMKRDLRKMGVQ